MKKQKVLATLLAAVMTMSMAACGSESNSQESSTASVTDSQSTVSSSSESEPEDNFTYPMEAVTLTINNDNDFYDMTDYGYVPAEDFFWNVLKEKTGVTLVNDGPTPEAYNFDEQYMPNLMKYLEENPDIKGQVTLDDGTLYCFPYVRDQGNQVETGAAVRKDWLEAQNLEVPETIDEWHDVLTTLKKAYNLSAPLSFESRWFFNEYAMSSLSSAYGTTYPFYVTDGTVHFGPKEDSYKEFITEMAKWYAEGLIDPDMPTVDKSTVTSKMASGESAITINQLSKMTSSKGSNEGTDYDLSPIPTAVLNKGDEPQMSHYRNAYDGSYSIAISTSCTNIEAACRFLDYMYSEEGSKLLNYGTEGVSYEEAADGTITFTDVILNNPDATASSARNAYGHYMNWAMASQQYSLQLDDWTRAMQEGWYAHMEDYAYPTVNYTTEEQETISANWSNIDDYCREMIIKFVIGSEPIENWDSFVSQLDAYHIDEVLAAKQAAYDRYLGK